MITEDDNETPNGWPLGLENMSTRLRVVENPQAAAAGGGGPSSLHVPSSSFSSFSSSSLDTESTASFFQDNSTTLGRLIGIKPGNRGRLYFPNTAPVQQGENASGQVLDSSVVPEMETTTSRGICVPLLHNLILKKSQSKSNAARL